jgi:hypothetical protein
VTRKPRWSANLAISSIDAHGSSGIVRTASKPNAAPQVLMAASTEPAAPVARQHAASDAMRDGARSVSLVRWAKS